MPLVNLDDYEAQARATLPAAAFDYIAGGSDDEVTLRANRTAFAARRLRPRVLVDVRQPQTATTLLGTPVTTPIFVAPASAHRLAHPDGELATARAAARLGTIMTVATLATHSLEAIAATGVSAWFQLYIYRDLAVTERLVRRAAAAGYRALVLTVDTPRLGRRERDLRHGFRLPPDLALANFADDAWPGELGGERAAITWESLAWLRGLTALPLILKGILTAEDARLAVAHGAAGIVVSNHGGRQLDGALPALDALPEIAAAVGDRCELYLDGGVRRGTDVLKALALGARAVALARPVLWGLAVNGEDGAYDVLRLLADEFTLAMALAGRPTLAGIDASLVC